MDDKASSQTLRCPLPTSSTLPHLGTGKLLSNHRGHCQCSLYCRTIVIGLGLAVLYIGNSIGAYVGHAITSQKWIFIAALIMQGVYVLYVLAILPESHTATKRMQEKQRRLALQMEKETPNRRLELAKSVGKFLVPFSMLLPTRVGSGTMQRPGRKWGFNVFLLSVAFGVGAMMMDVSGPNH